jgi:hypothetical protein
VQTTLTRHRDDMRRCFEMLARADLDLSDTTHASEHTMNVKEFFMFLKQADLLDHRLSVPRAIEVFMQCNFAPEDTDGWTDWDWELTFDEFEQAVVRLAVIKLEGEHAGLGAVPRLVDMFVANHMLPALEESARRSFGKAFTPAPPRIPGGRATNSPPHGPVLPLTLQQAQAAERRELAGVKSPRVGARRPDQGVRRQVSDQA